MKNHKAINQNNTTYRFRQPENSKSYSYAQNFYPNSVNSDFFYHTYSKTYLFCLFPTKYGSNSGI